MRVSLDEFVEQVHFQFHGELGLNEAIARRSPNAPDTDWIPTRSEEDSLLASSSMWLFGYQDPSPEFDLPGITKLVDLELEEEDCRKFSQTILNQLSGGKGGNLVDVFNAFLDQPKRHDLFTRVRPDGSRGEASALGKLKDSTAEMYLRKSDVEQTMVDADNVLQELFHFAGNGYNDRQLARALRATEYAKEAERAFPDGTADIFDKRYIPGKWTGDDGYSTYFHAIAARHCGYRPPVTYRNLK